MSELTDDEWNDVQEYLRVGLDVFRTTYGDDDNDNVIVEETDDHDRDENEKEQCDDQRHAALRGLMGVLGGLHRALASCTSVE